MQTDPKDTITAMALIKQSESDHFFIKGKRFGRILSDKLFTNGMSIIESLMFGMSLWDINAQPVFFPRAFYESWSNPPTDFSLDLYAYALAIRYKLDIIRIPVKFSKRANGSSTWNTGLRSKFKLINRTLRFSMNLRREITHRPHFLPKFIAHRINTIDELKELPDFIGVELDLRDRNNGEIILQHEPFTHGESFEEYLKYYHHGIMILNIKSERIEYKVLELLKKYNIFNYFFLDSSFPMIDLLSKKGENNFAIRYSEYEGLDTILEMTGRVKWVWVDCFTKLPIDQESYQTLKNAGFKLCLVSPELQGRAEDIKNYKKYLANEGIRFDAICTKSYNIKKWL